MPRHEITQVESSETFQGESSNFCDQFHTVLSASYRFIHKSSDIFGSARFKCPGARIEKHPRKYCWTLCKVQNCSFGHPYCENACRESLTEFLPLMKATVVRITCIGEEVRPSKLDGTRTFRSGILPPSFQVTLFVENPFTSLIIRLFF